MTRAAVAVALALLALLSGCNAFVEGGASDPVETVTPAPVPDVAPPATPTATSVGSCLAPRPARAPTGPRQTPAEPVDLTGPDGVVNGSTLVARHAQALSNVSFHLRVDGGTDVWSMPRAEAFTYEGTALSLETPWAYAVAGRLYTLTTDGGQLVLRDRAYDPGSATAARFRAVMTGERWLAERVGVRSYEVTGTRTWNGTEVRVLTDVPVDPADRGSPDWGGVVHVDSTLYVDRSGVIRFVRHVQTTEYVTESDLPNRTTIDTASVDQIGTAQLRRPAAFCVTDPDAVRTAAATTAVTPPSGTLRDWPRRPRDGEFNATEQATTAGP